MRYLAVAGLRLEPLEHAWAAFSPLSGETQLLNDESAAILEWLAEHGNASSADIARSLAEELAMSTADLEIRIDLAWGPLLSAGLVRRCDG